MYERKDNECKVALQTSNVKFNIRGAGGLTYKIHFITQTGISGEAFCKIYVFNEDGLRKNFNLYFIIQTDFYRIWCK